MQATNFLTLRGGYVHHRSSSLHPSVTSYSLLRRHNYVALRSSSTAPASCFTSNPGSPGIPRNDYMEKVLKWVTLSPLDEEYPEELKNLLPIFSQYGLFRYRVIIQVQWLWKQSNIQELNEVPRFSRDARSFLENIIHELTESDMHEVEKDHVNESAVINFLKERSKNKSDEISKVLQNYQYTCNSSVIELAFGMMLKEAKNSVIYPCMTDICDYIRKALFSMADDNHASVSLYGQAQPPTLTLVRELALAAEKLSEQAKCVSEILILGQFRSGGDNYNGDRYSFYFDGCRLSGDRNSYAEIDWRRINKEFVTSVGLEFDSNVDSENHINKLILEIINFNKILVDFSNELQSYISSGYLFKLERDPIKLEIDKINLLSPPNMIKTLDIKRPLSKRDLTGILEDMPQDQTRIVQDLPQDLIGVLGYSLVGYKAMLGVLKKLPFFNR